MKDLGKVVVLLFGVLAGCGSDGPTECMSDADCADLTETPSCDVRMRVCVAPCTSDVRGSYVCMEGSRHYCGGEMSLPCSVCPSSCSSDQYCSTELAACAPDKPGGEACDRDDECISRRCHEGLCSVEQGEPCTEATCDGFCAAETDGGSMCLRRCSLADCATESGDWACIDFQDVGAYCVPTCMGCFGSCSIGSCDVACSASRCVDFCAPEELNPEVFCR